jgi:hypothetical protein
MLRRYIGLISFLEVRWTCAHAEEAVDLLDAQFADLLFVDLKTVPVQPGSAFHTLVRKHSNVIVTVADLMDHAALHLRLRKSTPDGFGKAFQVIHASNENIFQAPVFQISKHLEPEAGAFTL